ncbi:hypothetical protein AYWB_153 [Aster yellows witches'-broom phytoplasma AYWB]|uniref:Uncharacterized protein n=1 Tax=Aster yellows witches'-broom phytoplasma (strain AYWB) TaxID=322098 RepID=Q2NJX3_AYWBP|nr:hypothetical protein [Aster yellows witches'-broom phytoplasma]ABC65270.1 hypothetical protein AYWB_153 [Aster yellows witches'-broom phytoplasma AYWB]
MIKINSKIIKTIFLFILIINYYLFSIDLFATKHNNNKKRKEIMYENIEDKKMLPYKLHQQIEEELEMKLQEKLKESKKNEDENKSNSKIQQKNNKKIKNI